MSNVIGQLTDANREVLERLKNDRENQEKLKSQQLDKDAFLILMMNQLKYQSPLEPLKNDEMIAQMAQFTSVEQMGMMTTAMAKQVEQNVEIINALKALKPEDVKPDDELETDTGTDDDGVETDTDTETKPESKVDTLIKKTDRTNELNEEILIELKKLNAQKAQEAYE